jgi:hypothetical protein
MHVRAECHRNGIWRVKFSHDADEPLSMSAGQAKRDTLQLDVMGTLRRGIAWPSGRATPVGLAESCQPDRSYPHLAVFGMHGGIE